MCVSCSSSSGSSSQPQSWARAGRVVSTLAASSSGTQAGGSCWPPLFAYEYVEYSLASTISIFQCVPMSRCSSSTDLAWGPRSAKKAHAQWGRGRSSCKRQWASYHTFPHLRRVRGELGRMARGSVQALVLVPDTIHAADACSQVLQLARREDARLVSRHEHTLDAFVQNAGSFGISLWRFRTWCEGVRVCVRV